MELHKGGADVRWRTSESMPWNDFAFRSNCILIIHETKFVFKIIECEPQCWLLLVFVMFRSNLIPHDMAKGNVRLRLESSNSQTPNGMGGAASYII
jgi:hypothetical protein